MDRILFWTEGEVRAAMADWEAEFRADPFTFDTMEERLAQAPEEYAAGIFSYLESRIEAAREGLDG